MVGRVLVTGAAGFIGNHVVRQLLAEGRQVRALLAPGEDPANLSGLDVECVTGDITNPAEVDRAVAGCEVVFHLAAIYALWLPDPTLMYRVNVEGTRHVMASCRRYEVRRVVHTSSIAAVGVTRDGTPADEDHSFDDFTLGNHYVMSKYLSELEALRWADRGVPVVVVNPAFPFGRGDIRPTPTGRIVLDILRRQLPAFSDGGLNAVDVEDVARGHLLAEKRGQVGRRYLLSGHNLSYETFVQKVSLECGVPMVRFKFPKQLVTLASWALMLTRPLTGRVPVLTPDSVAYSVRNLYYSNRRACEELGWSVTPLDETIHKAVCWFRDEWKGK